MARWPPSTGSMDPVMRLASEEQRNNTALANSSAEQMRPLIWNWAANSSTHSGFSAWAFLMGADNVHPGMTALTLRLSFAPSGVWARVGISLSVWVQGETHR